MINAKIVAIDYYLPGGVRSNQDIARVFPDFRPEKIEKKVGITCRHIAAPEETALDLAEKACCKLFENYDQAQIDFLLLCTQSPDYCLPPSSCILQNRLGLNKNVGALDYNLGCSGFVYGLGMAKGLIAGGIARKVLLITAETYSKHLSDNDRGNLSIFGDAAAATVVEACESEQIHQFSLGTDGSGAKNLIVKNGGMRSPRNGTTDDYLYMDGPAIFNFTLETLPPLIDDVLTRNQMKLEQIDYIIFHQANAYMLKTLMKLMNLPEDRFHLEMRETGNTVSATIPIALKQAMQTHKIHPGDKVLLAGFGVGYSYGATIITI